MENRHLQDLQETFETFRRYEMKLNPSKCVFEVSLGKFLEFMALQRGLEWTSCGPQPVRIKGHRQVFAILQDLDDGL